MSPSPAAARRRLGSELRLLREKAHQTIEDAARVLDCSTAKISRLENGKGVPQRRDVRDLIDHYQPTVNRDDLLELVEAGRAQEWFSSYRDVQQGELFVDHLALDNAGRFVYLERDAAAIRTFESDLFPGVLQTEEYIDAVCALLFPEHSDHERARFVEFRRERRKRLLYRPDPPKFSVILGEAAILRRIGGMEVMRGQLEALLKDLAGTLDFVNFRLVPLATNVRGSLDGPFSIMTFEDPREQDVVHLEVREGANYLESDEAVARYRMLYRELEGASLSRAESLERLAEEAARLG